MAELADPDSLEAKVHESKEEILPKWRIEQEQKRAAIEAQQKPVAPEGDVLEILESHISAAPVAADATRESAADEFGELIAPEALESAAPAAKAPSPQPRSVKPAAPAAAASTAKEDAAARMRAAAREKLKRAAAMSAPTKPAAAVKVAAPSHQRPESGELQLELLPDEPLKQASA